MAVAKKGEPTTDYSAYTAGAENLIELLVQENVGWATSIAKAVARAWNLDWQLDGLDGGAYEALLFCARRFDPTLGIPFRGYARRRIHESCTEEARKSKAWQQSTGAGSGDEDEQEARELSARIFDLFPELRDGFLPAAITTSAEGKEESSDMASDAGGIKSSIKQLLTGASLISAFSESTTNNQENIVDNKRMIEFLATLEPIHQDIISAIYYQGQSMRALAEAWELDDLSIVREHKEIIDYLSKKLGNEKTPAIGQLKVRRGLRTKSIDMKRKKELGFFSKIVEPA